MENVLTSKEFNHSLTTLMDEHAKGLKFQPKFNDIFTPFYKCNWSNLKVVVVTTQKNSEQIQKIFESDGVLVITTPLTWGEERVKHTLMWTDTIRKMIDQIGYMSTKTVFVFAEDGSEVFSSSVRKHHYKFFFPTVDGFPIEQVKDSINDLLKKIEKEPINW